MWLTIVGIALAAFGVLFGAFESIWDRFTKHMAFKGKRVVFLFITLILFALSCAIGYESYRLINHGKDKDEPLKGYIEDALIFKCRPGYVLYNSIAYKASLCYDMKPDYQIYLCNTNDLDMIIDSIDVFVDDYIDKKLDVYFSQTGGMGDGIFYEFYGNVHKNEKKVTLQYMGEGNSDYFDPSNPENAHHTYAKMEANSHDIVVPYAIFSDEGLYTIHYVINYSLNGQSRHLELPKQTVYLASESTPKYYFSTYDWQDYFGWYYDEFTSKVDNGVPIPKDKANKLLTVEKWHNFYIPNQYDPFADWNYDFDNNVFY